MKVIRSVFFAFSLFSAPSVFAEEEGFVPLFDGKSLDNWTSARALDGGESAFSVNEKEKAIHVYAGKEANSKQETDCLNTKVEFSHYILKIEYKWIGKRFAPRADWDRDAGLLFHVHGNLKRVWPMSLEMQIGESAPEKPNARGSAGRFHSGDLFVLGKGLKVDTKGKGGYFDANGKKRTGKGFPTKLGKEKPFGEWNEMEIQVHGSEKAVFILNGEVVHEITHFIQNDKDGNEVPLAKGRIGLQAEWAEIMYRKIRIKELKPQ